MGLVYFTIGLCSNYFALWLFSSKDKNEEDWQGVWQSIDITFDLMGSIFATVTVTMNRHARDTVALTSFKYPIHTVEILPWSLPALRLIVATISFSCPSNIKVPIIIIIHTLFLYSLLCDHINAQTIISLEIPKIFSWL